MREAEMSDDLDGLMQRIRTDVEARKARENARNLAPATGPDAAPAPLDPARLRYTAAELLAHYDVVFLRAAYLAVLGREPADETAARLIQQLRLGQISRIDTIDQLAATDEAQARGARISGLGRERVLERVRRSPLGNKLAALVRIARNIPRLASYMRQAVARIDTAERKVQQLERRLEEALDAQAATHKQLSQQIESLTQQVAELQGTSRNGGADTVKDRFKAKE